MDKSWDPLLNVKLQYCNAEKERNHIFNFDIYCFQLQILWIIRPGPSCSKIRWCICYLSNESLSSGLMSIMQSVLWTTGARFSQPSDTHKGNNPLFWFFFSASFVPTIITDDQSSTESVYLCVYACASSEKWTSIFVCRGNTRGVNS